jgi:hypothetical protein
MPRWSTSPIQQLCQPDQHRGSQEELINALLCTDTSSKGLSVYALGKLLLLLAVSLGRVRTAARLHTCFHCRQPPKPYYRSSLFTSTYLSYTLEILRD